MEISGDTAKVWTNQHSNGAEDLMVVTPSNIPLETSTDINQYQHLTDSLNLQDIHNFTLEGFNLIDLYKETLNKRIQFYWFCIYDKLFIGRKYFIYDNI